MPSGDFSLRFFSSVSESSPVSSSLEIYFKNGYQTFIDEIYANYIKHDVINECNMQTHQIKRLNDKSFNFDYNNGLTTGGK